MKRTLVVLLAAGSMLVGTAASAATSGTVSVLVWQGRTLSLATVDAATFRPRGGPLALGRAQGSVFTDRLGDRLVVASAGTGITVVDTRRRTVVWRLDRGRLVRAVGWVSPNRVVVVEHGGVLLLDPVRKRIVAREDFDGVVLSSAKWAHGLVVLAFRDEGSIEPARLFVIGPGVRVRSVELSRIAAGWGSAPTPTGAIESAIPALAVDVAGGRAFVAGGPYIATVELPSLALTYGGAERTLQKWSTGPRRSAAWLGDGILAVAGSDEKVNGSTPASIAFGLRYVSRSGVRLVDARATEVRVAGDVALAYGRRYVDGAPVGMGLVAYDRTGRLRWQLFGDAAIGSIVLGEGLAYVPTGRQLHVVEVATGRILATTVPRWSTFLVVG
jgi:hypothetical protein